MLVALGAAGGFAYVYKLKADNAILKANQEKLETAVQEHVVQEILHIQGCTTNVVQKMLYRECCTENTINPIQEMPYKKCCTENVCCARKCCTASAVQKMV